MSLSLGTVPVDTLSLPNVSIRTVPVDTRRFAARAEGSVFRGPILDCETVHAGELPLVVGDKGQPLRPGVRRDQ